jgi:hypothetical protein
MLILLLESKEEMASTPYLHSEKRAPRVAVWCWVLLSVTILPTHAISQDENDEGFDPFAPTSHEVLSVIEHLKDVNCKLDFAKNHKSVIGIYFGSPSRDKRLVELKDLEGLPNLATLRKLVVPKEAIVNDKWLPVIAKCKSLSTLALPGSDITPRGLEVLAKLSLTRVDFSDCKWLNDEAMETIADWEELRYLYLSNVPISDNGVHSIRGLTKLEELDMCCGSEEGNPLVTNRSVDVLKTFANLRELNLWGAHIYDDGDAELKDALPDCKIILIPFMR